MRRIADLGGSGGDSGLCQSAWFLKASEYVHQSAAKIGFVATNSITQGEQVGQLWPTLLGSREMEISFAHRTFAWGSDARGKAHIHVVILGLASNGAKNGQRRLFAYNDLTGEPQESQHRVLSPYLFDAGRLRNPHVVVHEASRPLNGLPKIVIGSKPIDGGHYIFTAEQKQEFLRREPAAEKFFRPYVGAKEFINGGDRWILALQGASPTEIRHLPELNKRIAAVKLYRSKSPAASTRALALEPTQFHVNVLPDRPFLVVPETSSENATICADRMDGASNCSEQCDPHHRKCIARIVRVAHIGHAHELAAPHWREAQERLSLRDRIGLQHVSVASKGLGVLMKLEPLAKGVLEARLEHPEASLGDLYHRHAMPVSLIRAHRKAGPCGWTGSIDAQGSIRTWSVLSTCWLCTSKR